MKEAVSDDSRSTCTVSSGCLRSHAGPWIHWRPASRRPFLPWRCAYSPVRDAIAASCILWFAITISSIGCRRTAPALDPPLILGEGPEQYSALVVRTVEQDGTKEVIESRLTVSGQMIREDWAEHGEKRALIVRPDLGESYLLFPDKGEFVVQAVQGGAQLSGGSGSPPAQGDAGSELPASPDAESGLDPIRIESDLAPSALPHSTSNIALPDVTIDSHPCKALERRIVLTGGMTEITRTYKAIDLSGMTIRTESESDGNGAHLRVVTERRDIQTGVQPTLFDIPAGFNRKAGSTKNAN